MGENGQSYPHALETSNMESTTEHGDFSADLDMWYDYDNQDYEDVDESYTETGGDYNGDYNDGDYNDGNYGDYYNEGDYNEVHYNDGDYKYKVDDDDLDCVIIDDDEEVKSPSGGKTKPGPVSSKPGPASSKPGPAFSKPGPAFSKPGPASKKSGQAFSKPGPASKKSGPASSKRGQKKAGLKKKKPSSTDQFERIKQKPPEYIIHEGYKLWLQTPSNRRWRPTTVKASYACRGEHNPNQICRGRVTLNRSVGFRWTDENSIWIREISKHNQPSRSPPPKVDPREGFVIFSACGRIQNTTDLRQQNPKTNFGQWHYKSCAEPNCKDIFIVESKEQLGERKLLGKNRQSFCWVCRAQFTSISLMRQHACEEHLGRKFICEVCQAQVMFKDLRAHEDTHNGFISFRMTFERTLEDIDFQTAPDIEKPPVRCDICHSETNFITEKQLRQHKDFTHFGKVIMCVLCGKTFRKPFGFDHKIYGRDCYGKFVDVFDKSLQEDPLILQYDGCDKCSKKWSKKPEAGWVCMRVHFNNDHRGRTFKCRVCLEDPGPLSSLLEHAETHGDDATFDAIYAFPDGAPGGKPFSTKMLSSQPNPAEKKSNIASLESPGTDDNVESSKAVPNEDAPANCVESESTQFTAPPHPLPPPPPSLSLIEQKAPRSSPRVRKSESTQYNAPPPSPLPPIEFPIEKKTPRSSPRVCPTCNETFSRVGDVYRSHLLRHVHESTAKDPVCPKCGVGFAGRELMVDHYMSAHGGVDRIDCEFPSCPESFRTQKDLVTHRFGKHGNA